MEKLKVGQVRVVKTHRAEYRPDDTALVVGVCMVKPGGLKERVCLMLHYEDGEVDYLTIQDLGKTYRIEGVDNN